MKVFRSLFVSIAVFLASLACAAAARGQPARMENREGIAAMIPADAIFYIERRGHRAVRQAFLESNLGEMAADEAIKQFVRDTRVRSERLIVREMFDLEEAEEIARHQKMLHNVLKPFWYNPSAMFLVLDEGFSNSPALGFICVTGKYQKECRDSLDAMLRIGVVDTGQEGTHHAVTYKKGTTTWKGIVKGDGPFTLPEDEAKRREILKDKGVFLTCWFNDVLMVALKLPAADSMSRMLSLTSPAKGKDTDPNFRAVMAKTDLDDWAFRWYLDFDRIMQAVRKGEDEPDTEFSHIFAVLGADRIRGIGGVEGYADKVYARKTYVYAPGSTRGLLRLFPPGGSYKEALSMVPDTSSMFLAGHLDTKATAEMIRGFFEVEAMDGAASTRPASRPATRPATRPAAARGVQLSEESGKIFEQIERLAGALDGDIGIFMTNIQGGPAAMMGGIPAGVVAGLKDRGAAVKAFDELLRLLEVEERKVAEDEEAPAEGMPGGPGPAVYRDVRIRYLGEMGRAAIMEDRIVLAMSDNAVKSVIDAARDKTGGFSEQDKSRKFAALCGDGPALFKMDLAAFAGMFWPMLMQVAEMSPDEFPLASMPSAAKMVRMLGPEIAVFQPDSEGLLMNSRGKIPFATKGQIILPGLAGVMLILW